MAASRKSADDQSRAEWGSDLIVEMMQRYGIRYAPMNLGSTNRGVWDSIVNFGDNSMPEIIECLHEEIAVAVAHGYAQASGKPAAAFVHSTVGTLHSTMAIYDAYAARTPVIVMAGAGPMSVPLRRPRIDWVHSALLQGNLVRDYVKWDDQPHDAQSFPESFARAYRVAMTEPTGPVYVGLDSAWQEARLDEPPLLPVPNRYGVPTPMQADPAALARLAELLWDADAPLILAGRVGRHRETVSALVELAETGGLPVIDLGGQLNFPNTHHLDATGTDLLSKSDLVLLIEVDQVEQALVANDRYTRLPSSRIRPDAKVITMSVSDVWMRSTMLDFGRLYPTELSIIGDSRLTVPALTDALRNTAASRRKSERVRADRVDRCSGARASARGAFQAKVARESSDRPVRITRLVQEVWNVIGSEAGWIATASETWRAAGGVEAMRGIFTLDRPGCLASMSGAAALGTALPKSIGVGLAAKDEGGFVVALGSDGELLYTPGAFWTAAHHNIPVLAVVRDNGGYQGEGEHMAWTSEHRGRSLARKHIGTDIKNPEVDIAAIARAQGAYAEGPIAEPDEVGPALARALEVVKSQSTIAVVTVRS